MINESKRRDARSWQKWEKSGALQTPPQVIERRELEARKWLEEHYRFNVDSIPRPVLDAFMEEMEQHRKERKSQKQEEDYVAMSLVKIEQHPELTLEEMDDRKTHEKYGITNNFWNYFFPELTDDLRHILLEGSLKESYHRSAKLLFWEQKGILISAFKRVGFERIKRMHESIRLFLELDAEWKRRVGDNPMRLCYGHRRIPESALIPEEEKKRYTKTEIDFENTLRVLALELYKEGVPFLDIHG